MFKFVNSDGAGTASKRQQSQRACEPCRKRKKRCHHSDTVPSQKPARDQSHAQLQRASPSSTQPSDGRGSDKLEHRNHSAQSSPVAPPPQPATEQDRAISGATPNLHRGDASTPRRHESLSSRFFGDLNPESIFLAATSPDATRGVSMTDSVGVWLTSNLSRRASQTGPTTVLEPSPSSLFYGSTSLVQKALLPLLEQECLGMMPSPARVAALSKIYFDKMHPIFPVVDEAQYYELSGADPSRILLQQSICLAASKNFAAGSDLILGESGSVLSPMEFGDKLAGAMRFSIEMGLVTNKIVLIQVLALMSQFVDALDGGDLSSQLCARAVHHVHSIGLHVKVRQGEDGDQYVSTLLCCIWAIDRMNAAFNGRPVLMHERDIRKDFEQCFQQQPPTFRIFIQVIVLLDKVIGLYRPSKSPNDIILDAAFPSFEEIVVNWGGELVGTRSLATIETLYHAVTILSCRSKTLTDTQRSSISYLRQTLSTSTLSASVGRELQELVPFPFVPYAVSLALSISYREMRHGKVSLHRARARTQFQTISTALSELKEVFRSAATTADMGKKLLKEMDRVVSTVAVSGTKTPLQQVRPNGNHAVPIPEFHDHTPPALNSHEYTESQVGAESNAQLPVQAIQDFDPSMFDSIADIDLFGMFDPAFNLDGFDVCLESNLNPAFPTYFE